MKVNWCKVCQTRHHLSSPHVWSKTELPADVRKKALTNAEHQARWRAEHRDKSRLAARERMRRGRAGP